MASNPFATALATLHASALAVAADYSVDGEDPVPIRVGWVAPVANFASILLMKPALMHNQGKTYNLEPQHFASTPTMIPALAAGEIAQALDIILARLRSPAAAHGLDVVFTQALAEDDRQIVECRDLDDHVRVEHNLGGTPCCHVGRIRDRKHAGAVS